MICLVFYQDWTLHMLQIYDWLFLHHTSLNPENIKVPPSVIGKDPVSWLTKKLKLTAYSVAF